MKTHKTNPVSSLQKNPSGGLRRFKGFLVVIGGVSLLAMAPYSTAYAEGYATFKWSNPEKYSDLNSVGPYEGSLREFSNELQGYADHLANRFLPDGSLLEIVVTEVDLAGEMEPTPVALIDEDEVRIIRDIYPPRMNFDYTLKGVDGQVLKKGSEHLAGLNLDITTLGRVFQPRKALILRPDKLRRYFSEDHYFYEKEMFGEWFHTAFVPSPKD